MNPALPVRLAAFRCVCSAWAVRGCAALLDPSERDRLVQMATKIRRLVENSRLGDASALTSLGNPYRCVRSNPDKEETEPMNRIFLTAAALVLALGAPSEARVSRSTVALMAAWQAASIECNKESVGGDKIGDKFPKSCAAMQPLGEQLDKRGCRNGGRQRLLGLRGSSARRLPNWRAWSADHYH